MQWQRVISCEDIEIYVSVIKTLSKNGDKMWLSRIQKAFAILHSRKLLNSFIKYGVFPGAEHRFVLSKELNTIVDIGANKGQFALACIEWAPNATVISFEPLPGPSQVFTRLFKHNQNVQLHKFAIGPKHDKVVMHVSAREDSSSLLPIGVQQITAFPGTHESYQSYIELAPLSAFMNSGSIKAPAFLKIDVQGYEMEVLIGCQSLLENFNFIYCECSFIELYSGQKLVGDIIKWLENINFSIVGVFNVSYDKLGMPIQGDFLFERNQ
jgi:FkbM family methyltransferase